MKPQRILFPALRRSPVRLACSLLTGAGLYLSLNALTGLAAPLPPVVPLKVEPFPLQDVRLGDGPFRHAMEVDREYLLSLDVDRLLHNFRVQAGLPSGSTPLGGWEEPKCELRGHFVGHYLSACALMFASTGDARLKEKGDALVAGLIECQEKAGSGYLSAFPESYLDRVEAGQPVWAPYYTLHKIAAGLLDMFVYGGNAQALPACQRFADWLARRNDRLSDAQMQKMLETEHGGMNEVLANLFGLTGDAKYLQIAQRFNHHAVLAPAAQQRDQLTGLHANTQIPKFIGAARQFELTGQPQLQAAAQFFWKTVVNERSYVIGGDSDHEHFTPKEHLSEALGPDTTETCNTYNMLKLTRHLFTWDPDPVYADYYERALYNHILASQNPANGMTCYYVPLRSGSHKSYSTPTDSFWCCTGTGVENHAKYGDSIYFHDARGGLYLNLFIASELNWKAKRLKIKQETRFPEESSTRLSFTCEEPTELTLHLRRPAWAVSHFEVRVNGRRQWLASQPGDFALLSRTWSQGDTVEISMPFALRVERFRDNPRRFAVLNGPLVLCAQVDPAKPAPGLLATPEALLESLTPIEGRPSTFACPPDLFRMPGESQGPSLVLEPFYQMHGNRSYEVYWDAFTPTQWQAKEEEQKREKARLKILEARTADIVLPGNDPSEREHNPQGERSERGSFGGRTFRHATGGGWFSWQLRVLPEAAQELSVTYWGSDTGRTFDVLVDGVKIATQKLAASQPGQFFDVAYALPPELVQGKEKITVKFQAPAEGWAGGVFGLRLLKPVTPDGASEPQAKVTVQADRPGHAVSPNLWGIFFEDINLSADGGIYPELVRNRSFEDSENPEHWRVSQKEEGQPAISIDSSKPLNAMNRHSLRVQFEKPISIVNEGYWGMNFVQGEVYQVRLAARSGEGFKGPVTVAFEGATGAILAQTEMGGLNDQWKQWSAKLTPSASDAAGRLKIRVQGKGTLWLDMVSVLPAKTWKEHGLRPDLCEMLAELKPSFLRFPGGCWVEGEDLAHMYHWKETIGDVSVRKPLWNIWAYQATQGLGFHEYLQLAEDLGTEPLFCINVGMSHRENVPLDQMHQWVQDALDAVEYANGATNTLWGAVRARNGHPAPFRLKYMEIGNENGGPAYQDRYTLFYDALKARHAEITLIANVPTDQRPAEIVDEHYYNSPEFFIRAATQYDNYPRNGPKIFVGEYAVTVGGGQGNLRAAIGEAAFMTGLERNSDVVQMASYAPLLVNVRHKRWNPDLINFDSSRAYGLPSYYVQQMFSENRGDVVLPATVLSPDATETPGAGLIGVGTWLTQAEFKDIKVSSGGKTLFATDFAEGMKGWKTLGGNWKAQDGVLRQDSLAENVRALAGDDQWTDYTYTLKARKLGGAEGFLILFRVQDEEAKSWWNIGGWGNQRHALEIGGILGKEVPGSIETGRWYDIRIEVKGKSIQCYLDGQLIHDVTSPTMQSIYASATRHERTGEVIIKAVNVSSSALETEIDLQGIGGVDGPATIARLTSARPTDENSLTEPKKVAPDRFSHPVNGPQFREVLPGNSVTIIRVKPKS